MINAYFWSAVAILVSVLGAVIWRYASSQQHSKQSLYTAETLARRTIKKSLNTNIAVKQNQQPAQPTTYMGPPIAPTITEITPAVHYPVREPELPRVDHHQPTSRRTSLLHNSVPYNHNPAPPIQQTVPDDIPYLSLQPQYKQSIKVPAYTNPPPNNIPLSNVAVSPATSPTTNHNNAQHDVKSPDNRKRGMANDVYVDEDNESNSKKTRRSTSVSHAPPNKDMQESANQPQQPAKDSPQSQQEQDLKEQAQNPRPLPQPIIPTPEPSAFVIPSTPTVIAATPVHATPTAIPATPIPKPNFLTPSTSFSSSLVPTSPNESMSSEQGEGTKGLIQLTKKRTYGEQLDVVHTETQKRRRVPAFSEKKKPNPIASGVLNDTTEEEEREKRVLFMLKRAQDAPKPTPARPTPTKPTPTKNTASQYVPKSPYKPSTPLKIPKLDKYKNRRVYIPPAPKIEAPAESLPITTAPLSIPLTTTTSTTAPTTIATTTATNSTPNLFNVSGAPDTATTNAPASAAPALSALPNPALSALSALSSLPSIPALTPLTATTSTAAPATTTASTVPKGTEAAQFTFQPLTGASATTNTTTNTALTTPATTPTFPTTPTFGPTAISAIPAIPAIPASPAIPAIPAGAAAPSTTPTFGLTTTPAIPVTLAAAPLAPTATPASAPGIVPATAPTTAPSTTNLFPATSSIRIPSYDFTSSLTSPTPSFPSIPPITTAPFAPFAPLSTFPTSAAPAFPPISTTPSTTVPSFTASTFLPASTAPALPAYAPPTSTASTNSLFMFGAAPSSTTALANPSFPSFAPPSTNTPFQFQGAPSFATSAAPLPTLNMFAAPAKPTPGTRKKIVQVKKRTIT